LAGFFITGTGTDVGKTYVTAGLIRALQAQGRLVDAFKPVLSGFDPAHPGGSDAAVLLEALGLPVTTATLDHISPWRFAAPLSPPLAARREGLRLDGAEVAAACRTRVAGAHDALLLIEGAGGVMSPLDERRTMLDLAGAAGLPVILVAGSYLGTISHTLSAAAVLRGAGLQITAVVVSESKTAPPMGETLDALRAFLSGTPVAAVARHGSLAGVIDLL
jgi:dethiobiotin synthetase